jgi:hypothetical protein
MKSSILKKLQGIYQPVNQNQHDHLNFSLEQTLHSHEYVGESVQTLRELCRMVILDVKQILVTCCDILEMLKNVPSVSKKHECVDMSCIVCHPVKKLAAYMDAYDVDPNNVTIAMIQAECELIANHS